MAENKTTPLYEKLRVHPTAPSSDFDKFMVGNLVTEATKFTAQLRKIMDGDLPSMIRLIIGPNGNGKTMLLNYIRGYISDLNTREDLNNFNVLFSTITLNDLNPNLYGIELAKNLQRTIYELPNLTYSSISKSILNKFIMSLKPPFAIRFTSWPVKYALKKAIKKYDETLKGLISTDEADPISVGLDKAFTKIQNVMMTSYRDKAFRDYAQSHQMNSFLLKLIDHENSDTFSIQELNSSLYRDLDLNQRTKQSLDTVKALASIAKDVDCKLLVLMVDDFNQRTPSNILLPLIDSLSTFSNPRVLLIVSGLESVWREYEDSDPLDKSLIQKMLIFGNPIKVSPPSNEDLNNLYEKLFALMNSELSTINQWIPINDERKSKIVEKCPATSFREATKYIIDELESEIVSQ